MEAIVGGRSSLGEDDLKVVKLLERILSIPLDISMMSNKSYNNHLALND
jgi:hypothetical protein